MLYKQRKLIYINKCHIYKVTCIYIHSSTSKRTISSMCYTREFSQNKCYTLIKVIYMDKSDIHG